MVEEQNTEEIKCTFCQARKHCRKHSITKGSATCEVNRGIRESKKKEPSKTAQGMGMLSFLLNKNKEKEE